MTTVLLVEDDSQLRIALRATFRARAHDTVEAETGEAGLLALAQREPQIVVLDLVLRGIDGVEVLRCSSLPVIVLTVRHQLDDELAALEAGATTTS